MILSICDVLSQNSYDMVEYQRITDSVKSFSTSDKGLKIVKTALLLLNKPYKSNTLEINYPDEFTVINLSEFDCLTFVENVVALVNNANSNNASFDNFKCEIENLRYRNGLNKGWSSRLHYASDWIYDNCKKGLISDVTLTTGGNRFVKDICFMSNRCDKYNALMNNTVHQNEIKQIEKQINARQSYCYIAKDKLPETESKISSGSIIFIATNIPMLDYSHTGIAYQNKGKLYLIHASSVLKKIVVSDVPLIDYLNSNNSMKGISVLKVL